MGSQVQNNFGDFFEQWMSQLEEYVQLLVHARREKSQEDHHEENLKALVDRLTQHHKDYYTAKWTGIQEDVFVFFSPPWLTPRAKAYSWITGWRPSAIFSLVASLKRGQVLPGATTTTSLADLTHQQQRSLESLRGRIRVEEDNVEREMERQQLSVAGPKMVRLVMLVTAIKNKERPPLPHVDGMVKAALKELMFGMETVVRMADCVRLNTLKGILDVLSPMQNVDFFAASSMLLIEMRK